MFAVILSFKKCIIKVLNYIVYYLNIFFSYLLKINGKGTRTVTAVVDAKILPLQSLYYESVCSLMYDVNKNTAPDNILKLFSRISSVHTYNTRASTSEHFYTKESRLNVKRNAFSRAGVKIWNGIPQILKERDH